MGRGLVHAIWSVGNGSRLQGSIRKARGLDSSSLT